VLLKMADRRLDQLVGGRAGGVELAQLPSSTSTLANSSASHVVVRLCPPLPESGWRANSTMATSP
jgi:hypothetical protein